MVEPRPALSLRAHVEDLAAQGWLRDVPKAVEADWEIACIARWALAAGDAEPYALRFLNIVGHRVPLVLGLFGSRRQIARSLGVEPDGLWARWARALEAPIEPSPTDRASVKDVILRGAEVDLGAWPIPIWTPGRDRAPYLSTACVVTADREDGTQNVGTYRIEVQGPRRLGLAFGSERQHGAMHRKTWEDAGEPMPVALVLGAAPAVSYAAAAKLPYGVDELTIAGGLLGSAVDVTTCESHHLQVPANAELVIEGFVRPGERAPEGPFGECLGYMESGGPASVIDVECITHRRDPILHGLIQQVPPSEGHLLMEVGLLGPLWHYLTGPGRIHGLVDLGILPGAAGVSILAISVRAGDATSARQVLRAMAQLSWGQKLVVVVDEDIDVHHAESVLWALSSRADFGADLTVQGDAPMYQWDPAAIHSAGGRSGDTDRTVPHACKLLIDATLKADCLAVALPTPELMERARRSWSATGLPPLGDTSALERLLRHFGDGGLEHALPRPDDAGSP